ncbi:RutC family protein [Colletotrichum siamense]|uniref:RutC family protein n=1 Tax=Colletotrichum siamense TaxID=690259 RepID=UPI0018730EE8|nr:RutC family protein [Colletotrichum siamense]KAF5511849.1 RutC family protein [Colletotrichum siamense]
MSDCQRKPIITKEAPGPYPPLSQAMVHGGFVFCSGSIGMNPQTNSIVEGTIADRTTQALTKLGKVLEAAGSGTDKILKVNIYVTSMEDIPLMNEAYMVFFAEPRPARACVCVKALARGTDVEIECTGFI